jgi:cytochrome c-type biogenesis protein CcmE
MSSGYESSIEGAPVAEAERKALRDRLSRKQWIAAGALGMAFIIWFLLFVTVGGDFYQSVEELKAGGPQQNVRVGGLVSPGTIQEDSSGIVFVLEGERGEQLEVAYVGAVPGRLGPLEQVVAAGSLTDSGRFEATELLLKCPDKLFAEKATNGLLGAAGLERILY